MRLRFLKAALPVALVAAAFSVAAPAQAAAPSQLGSAVAAAQFAYSGDAYGTKVSVGNTVTSGRSAPVSLGCGTTPGVRKTNTVASVDASPLLTSGTVSTTAGTFASPTKSRTSATVQDVNLLGGLITGTAVKSVSSTIYDGTNFSTNDNGTTFTNLKIGTLSVDATVAPNTRIDILGGYVILNEQVEKIGARSASLTVNAIHVFLTDGTEIIVAHARSGLKGPVVGTLDGFAYGSKVVLGSGLVTSGPSFRQGLPCLGTNGKLKVNEGAGVSVGSLLDTGTIRNTATGTVNATTADGETTSTVQSANVLNGLVTATVIKATAHATKNADGTFTFTGDASFATLSVQGFPAIGVDVARNTKLDVGVGTLYLNRVIRRANSIEVRAIELVLNNGDRIQVAVAHASAH